MTTYIYLFIYIFTIQYIAYVIYIIGKESNKHLKIFENCFMRRI